MNRLGSITTIGKPGISELHSDSEKDYYRIEGTNGPIQGNPLGIHSTQFLIRGGTDTTQIRVSAGGSGYISIRCSAFDPGVGPIGFFRLGTGSGTPIQGTIIDATHAELNVNAPLPLITSCRLESDRNLRVTFHRCFIQTPKVFFSIPNFYNVPLIERI